MKQREESLAVINRVRLITSLINYLRLLFVGELELFGKVRWQGR